MTSRASRRSSKSGTKEDAVTEPRITIIDVARAASVHPSTVSRVLNGRVELSLLPETRERVIAAAARLGYRPSALARSLRLRRTFTLGMLVPNIDNPLFPPIIKGVEDVAHARGYNLILCNTEDSSEREATYLRVLRERQVDGLLIASSFMADSTIAELRRDRFPFVLVNRGSRGANDLAVLVDNEVGVAEVIEHLVGLGHRRIGIVAGPQTTMTGQQRLAAARASLREHRVKLDPALVAVAEAFSQEAGYRAARRLVLATEPPTAIFGANDLIALGVLRAIREVGLECPDHISLVGFNDIPQAEFFGPPLTTVHVPQRDMGTQAATMLIAQIEGKDIPAPRVVAEAHLVVRGSTAAPATLARSEV
ncbi:MAG: LacI family transcriptional regulator [Chloroflexi bacterium]|nr:MAG: LacI family transcriptional regulator [Chloroflexota bacterium]